MTIRKFSKSSIIHGKVLDALAPTALSARADAIVDNPDHVSPGPADWNKNTRVKIGNALTRGITCSTLVLAISVAAALINSRSANAMAYTLDPNATKYFQDFNGLANGLPTGWGVYIDATATSMGIPYTLLSDTGASATWSSTARGFKNYASTAAGQGASAATQHATADRALGVRQVGPTTEAGFDPGAAFVFQIANTVGMENFQLTFDAMTLDVQGRTTTWLVQYGFGENPNAFTTVGDPFSGPATFGSEALAFNFGNALNDINDYVWIRIVTLSPTTGSGNRDTFAIDNFSLTYAQVPEPASLAILGLGAAMLIARRRK